MAGHSLTNASTLLCPHGGQVQIVTSNTRSRAGGTFLVTVSDTFVVQGCPFQIPAVVPIPSPCVKVVWVNSDTRVRVNGAPSLSRSSTGLCISAMGAPQGPVIVANTQPRMQSQ